MFLLLLALLIGLVLGQFIKIELPPEAKQELIRAIKSISGTVKAAFDRLMSEIQQQRSIDLQPSSIQLQSDLPNGKPQDQNSIKAVTQEK